MWILLCSFKFAGVSGFAPPSLNESTRDPTWRVLGFSFVYHLENPWSYAWAKFS